MKMLKSKAARQALCKVKFSIRFLWWPKSSKRPSRGRRCLLPRRTTRTFRKKLTSFMMCRKPKNRTVAIRRNTFRKRFPNGIRRLVYARKSTTPSRKTRELKTIGIPRPRTRAVPSLRRSFLSRSSRSQRPFKHPKFPRAYEPRRANCRNGMSSSKKKRFSKKLI